MDQPMDKPWKMLVYISADNTLYNDALVSLRQLTDASLRNNVDIIVQLDGPSSDQVSRYQCAGGQKKLLWEAPDGYEDDRSIRLRHFLGIKVEKPSNPTPPGATNSFARPAEGQRVALVLWGHGAGLDTLFQYNDTAKTAIDLGTRTPNAGQPAPASGIAEGSFPDNANLYVTNVELGNDLSSFVGQISSYKPAQTSSYKATQTSGYKIDLLGLDSCLMGMVEICHEVSDSVSVMVASDEDVPTASWPYDSILSDLNKFPGMDANTLSTVIIDRFLERYTQKGNRTRVSLSSMDLSGSNELVTEMKGLVDTLNAALAHDSDGKVRRTIFRARDISRTPDEVAYIDFGAFCRALSDSFSEDHPEVSQQANKVRDVLLKSPYILYHRDAGEDGSIDPYGLAIYFPPTLDRITSQLNVPPLKAKVLPRDDVKFPASNKTKFPASNKTKSPDGSQIIGYEILWGNYTKLKFNTQTGWAALVYGLLGGTYKAAQSAA